ncbi:MAG TPA: TatD family hydrolase, partial [Xanthobacteraceae bacterium]|nr:TatD family hydrolase [Xanthobacteraceae bacterium]
KIAAMLPENRILVETDAPYLAPQPFRGKRNEPSYVVETARVLAEARGIQPERAQEITTANFHRLFGKVPAA